MAHAYDKMTVELPVKSVISMSKIKKQKGQNSTLRTSNYWL